MKNKSFLNSLLAVFMCMCYVKSFAYSIEVKNADGVTIYYSWRNNVTELAVTHGDYDVDAPTRGFYSGEVVIPESVEYGGKTYKVTAIYDNAFMHCMGLTSVTIPNSVTSIGERAFGGCSSLTSVTIPNGVTSIGNEAFGSCGGLISIMVESGNQTYDSRNNCNAIIEKSSNTLIAGCKNTIIPNSVTSIGEGAFYGCSGLTSITIPNSVTSIGNSAFSGCGGLTSITIPNSVTSIGGDAFYRCSGLTSATIPNSVTSIGRYAFYGCSGLTSVTIPNSVTSIGSYAFSACGGLTSVTIPNSVQSIGDWAFSVCIGLNSVTIPNSVTSIGRSAFSHCSSLESIVVENGNTKYDSRNNCEAIIETESNTLIAGCKNTIIPSNVTSIVDGAFGGCSGLTSIDIPNSVTSIGGSAFEGCSGLTSVTIPNSVTSISSYAFYFCSGLTTIVSEIDKPFKIENTVFNGIPSDAQLIVPKGTKVAYQSTEGWNRFTNIVEAGETGPDQPGQIHINNIYFKVTESGEAEVVSAENRVTNITIPSTVSYNNTSYKVMSIAKDAFENCEQLSAVIWEPEVQFNAKVNNPNFLLYVSDEKYASRSVKNVVVNGVAESIELTDAANGNDFYCPRAFKARSIVYSHNYQMETGIGDSRGWETIVLPFDVQKYTHATKGELESFTTWSKGSSKKPFWLFELTASGYKDVAGIKANTPYIISMPNNQQYEQQYQIPGIVTFSASDVEVQKSDNLKPGSYQGRSLVPNYTNKSDENYLALNVSNNYVTNPGKDISGSKFVRGLRTVHPFEAYMITTDNTRSIDVMEGMTTAIRGIQMVKDGVSVIKVYDTRGVLMKTATSMDDVWNGLKAGVYIVNGKKIVIK